MAVLAGTIMMESSAESYRVEDTVKRILQTAGLPRTEVVCTTTGLFLTLADYSASVDPITLVRRVNYSEIHLNKIYRVNQISRLLTAGEIDLDEALERLLRVSESEYSVHKINHAIALFATGFALLLGGSTIDVLVATLAGVVMTYSRRFQKVLRLGNFMHVVFNTALVAFFISMIVAFWPSYNMHEEIIITSSFMSMFPGAALINGIRDIIKGDYVSGIARVVDALVTALAIAVGVAGGLLLRNEVVQWIL